MRVLLQLAILGEYNILEILFSGPQIDAIPADRGLPLEVLLQRIGANLVPARPQAGIPHPP